MVALGQPMGDLEARRSAYLDTLGPHMIQQMLVVAFVM
jgi:hypothetical protein